MMTCESCQAQLLAHLYGLLEDADRHGVVLHLNGCPPCRAALDKAREQQRILAAAAKSEFPTVRFGPVTQPAGAASTRTMQRPRRVAWGRWAVAACILVLVGSAAGFAGVAWFGYRGDVDRTRDELASAQRDRQQLLARQQAEHQALETEMARIQEQLKLIEAQYKEDLTRVQRDYETQPVQFSVSHPKTLQAGGRNLLKIDAKRKVVPMPGGKGDPYFLVAVVVDEQTQTEVARKQLHDGGNDFELPADLPLKPGAQLSLKVLAIEQGSPAVAGSMVGAAAFGPLNAPLSLLAGKAQKTLVQEMLPLVTSLYVTHLTTDRPLYRPGEVVHFRSLTLERFSLKPADEEFELHFRLVRTMGQQEQTIEVLDPETGKPARLIGSARLKGADGKPLTGPDGKELRGIGAGSFKLPDDLGGGEYTLIVKDAHDRFPAEKRRIIVNRYQAPRLLKDVDFTRKSYGPGDTVTASCKVAPAEGGRVIANQPVHAVATVDGAKWEFNTRTDATGSCVVQFRLPAKIEKGEGILEVMFSDGANVETTVEPIPIVLNKLKVEFFPEGGELVAGVSNRVYFQVRTMLNRPAELRGRIVDRAGKEIAAIATLSDDKDLGVNQGMGRFDFTPEDGQTYELKIDAPTGIEGSFWLPPVQTTGVVLHLPQGVVGDKIDVELASVQKARKLLIGAYCRGQMIDHQLVDVAARQRKSLALKPAAGVSGVYRVTVFEVLDGDRMKPVAERLLYRRSQDKLTLQVFTDKKAYSPGDRVTLSLTATDQHNKPAPAVVVISVVDKSVLKLRNDRTARALPTHFLLTSEVRGPEDLEQADFLLAESPKAEQALDLLLGTQGWRRFLEQKQPADRTKTMTVWADDAEKIKADVQRVLVHGGQAPQQEVKESFTGARESKVALAAATKYVQAQKGLAEKETLQDARDEATQDALNKADVAIASKQSQASMARSNLDDFYTKAREIGGASTVLLLCVGGLALVLSGFTKANNEKPHALRYLVAGCFCFFTLMVVGVGYIFTEVLKEKSFSEVSGVIGGSGGAPMRGGAGQMAQPEMAPAPMDRADAGVVMAKKDAPRWDKNAAPKQADEFRFKAPGALPGANLGQKDAGGLELGGAKAKPVPPPVKRPMGGGANVDKEVVMRLPQGFQMALDDPPQAVHVDHTRLLRKEGKFAQLAMQALGGEHADGLTKALQAVATAEAFAVREYAHQHKTSPDAIRRDWTETVYWHPALIVPGDKKLVVHFDLSDAVTQFHVQVWGHTTGGQLGAVTTDIASRLPFSVDAKLPTEISSTDKVSIPVALTNETDKNLNVKLKVEADKLTLQGDAEQLLPLGANSRLRKVLHFSPSATQGEAKLRLFGLCDPFGSDSIERTFKIVPEGFPVAGKRSDMLEGTCEHLIKLPAKRSDWVAGTLKLQAQVFPSTLADLQKGLEALLREPGGCFEQTSSSNYPNVMILDYLKESEQVKPDLEKKARAMLDRGYGKLVSFECIDPKTAVKKEGYEWFGQTAPPHEALTAYGLLQFLDMAKYQPVDPAMLERTKSYLLKQRNGKGGFKRNDRALDSFGRAPDHITDAYIVWALCEAQVKEDISLELKTVVANAEKSEDPYMLALAGLSLLKRGGDSDKAMSLLKKLRTKQKDDGSLIAKETSITHSGGLQLTVETTSLAVLAWLRANQPQEFAENVRKSADWIGKQRGAFGGYGSTQSTVLALKALIAFTSANKKTAEAGELRLFVNGNPASVKAFPAGMLDPLIVEVPDERMLKEGENTIRVEITGKNNFPHTVTWTYMAITPANKDACPVRLTTKLSDAKATEGQTVRVTAELENVSGKEQGMAVAIVGLPGGCAAPTDLQELRNLVKAGKIDAFEILGREVVLYWRGLDRGAKKVVNFSVICQVPGQYRGPASRGYLYYDNDERWWVDPLAVEITPRD